MANACGLYELYRDQLISDHANSLDSKQFSISAPGAIHCLSNPGSGWKWQNRAEMKSEK